MEKFTNLGLSRELTDVLKESGFTEPSEIQKKAIPLVLTGKDVIGGSATGSGKTLAFSSAIIENLRPSGKVQALILTPTRELAEQVAGTIRTFGKNKKLNVLAVYGGVRIDSQIRKIPRSDVIVGTPGRIIDHMNRRTLKLDSIKFLVLDEVDRMFDMGFKNDVEKIIVECPRERQTMLFSATISSDIDYLAKKYTRNPVEVSVKSHVDASQLKQIYYDVPDHKKFSLLVSLLKKENADLVMVFCNTRRNSDFVASNLIGNGIHAKSIHGGIDQKKRIRVLDEFHKKGLGVLVCTDVAARGLDIKGVSHVYNYDVPKDSKDYVHRIGRTARAGKDGKAIVILARRDYENFDNLLRAEGIKINPEELPKIESARINKDAGKKKFDRSDADIRRRDNRGGSNNRRPRGNHDRNSNDRRSQGRFGARKERNRFSRNKTFGKRNYERRDSYKEPDRGSSQENRGRRFGDRKDSRGSYGRDRDSRGSRGKSFGKKRGFNSRGSSDKKKSFGSRRRH